MSLKLYFKYFRLFIVLFFLFSCGRPIGCGEKVPEEYKIFFSKPIEEQHREFIKLPLEKQYEFHIYAMTRIHPPYLGFAKEIVITNGEKVILFLTSKLKEEKDETRQMAVIYLFTALANEGYNIRDNKELIQLMERIISSMKYRSNIELTKLSLKMIMGQR